MTESVLRNVFDRYVELGEKDDEQHWKDHRSGAGSDAKLLAGTWTLNETDTAHERYTIDCLLRTDQ
jgi:hypothetical protein